MIADYIKRTGFGEGVSFMCQRHLTTNNPTQGTQCGGYKKERALAKEFPISARGTALLITPHKERSVGDINRIQTNNNKNRTLGQSQTCRATDNWQLATVH